MTEQNVECEGTSGVGRLQGLLVFFQKEKGQTEGFGHGVFGALNPCPETVTSGKYSRICHWANLLTNSFFGIVSLLCVKFIRGHR